MRPDRLEDGNGAFGGGGWRESWLCLQPRTLALAGSWAWTSGSWPPPLLGLWGFPCSSLTPSLLRRLLQPTQGFIRSPRGMGASVCGNVCVCGGGFSRVLT